MESRDLLAIAILSTMDFSDRPWMAYAIAELGVTEAAGAANNPRVVKYLKTVGYSDDSVPWCSAFVNWCMQQAKYKGTDKPNARSWLNWVGALPMASPQLGAVTIFTREGGGHVGFYVNTEGDDILVLGGNQKGDAVNVRPYAKSRLLGYRWPVYVQESE